jgi:hypothetical protein
MPASCRGDVTGQEAPHIRRSLADFQTSVRFCGTHGCLFQVEGRFELPGVGVGELRDPSGDPLASVAGLGSGPQQEAEPDRQQPEQNKNPFHNGSKKSRVGRRPRRRVPVYAQIDICREYNILTIVLTYQSLTQRRQPLSTRGNSVFDAEAAMQS